MPTATDLVTDLPADFAVFGQAVDTSMAGLLGGTTGQVLSKTSATNMAFTWVTPELGDITAVTAGTGISGGGTTGAVTITNSMATAITTSGDLIQGTGSGTFARLGSGTNGQILTTNGTTLSWTAAPTSGSMTSIASGSLSGTSLTLSSIAQTYKHLYLVINNPGFTGTASLPMFRINGNASASNYGMKSSQFGTATWLNNTALAYIDPTVSNGTAYNTAANYTYVLQIENYASTTFKRISYAAMVGFLETFAGFGNFLSAAAITSLTFSTVSGVPTFNSGTYILYGVN